MTRSLYVMVVFQIYAKLKYILSLDVAFADAFAELNGGLLGL
jgi:hypothetical protein